MATIEEMARNRVAGDYPVLAEPLLGNGGRVALPPCVLPGRWTGTTNLSFDGVPGSCSSAQPLRVPAPQKPAVASMGSTNGGRR